MNLLRYVLVMIMAITPLIVPLQGNAQTYAYIPGLINNNVVRVDTASADFASTVDLECIPYGAAVAPKGAYVLVSCQDGLLNGSLFKITNAFFGGTTIPPNLSVGRNPQGIAIDPSGAFAYVANYADDSVSEIDLNTFAIGDTIDVNAGPKGVAAYFEESSDTYVAYVANYDDGSISVIRNGLVTDNLPLNGKPNGLALSPLGSRLYAAVEHPGSVANPTALGELTVIRTSDLAVIQRIPFTSRPWGVAVGDKGRIVFVTQYQITAPGIVTLYYPAAGTLTEIVVNAARLTGIAAPKNSDYAFAVGETSTTIYKIDAAALRAEPFVENEINGAFALGAFVGGAPPAAPSALSATADSYDSVTLTWSDNAADELGFEIERREQGTGDYLLIVEVGADTGTYQDRGLVSQTTYEYRIRAFNEAAESDYTVLGQGVTTLEGMFSWCFIGVASGEVF